MSTREVSVLVWAVAFALWALTVPGVRKAVPGVLQAALHWKLVVPFVLLALYVGLCVSGLWWLRFWTPAHVKDTVVWFLFSGVALAFSAVDLKADKPTLRTILRDQVKAVVLVEYVLNTYTFALWVELLLVPAIAAVAMIDTVARMEQQYEKVARLTNAVLAIAGFVVLGFALREAVAGIAGFSTVNAARDVVLPIVLSCMLLPTAYVFFLLSAYEQLFLVLRLGSGRDSSVIRYARRRLVWRFGPRPQALHQFLRERRIALLSTKTKMDVDQLLESWRTETKAG